MRRVLVTDAEQRSALAVVRSLGRVGHHVEVASSRVASLAGGSRFAKAEHVVPDPASGAEAFVRALGDLVRDQGIDMLVPMTDVSASVALSLREQHRSLLIPFPPRTTWESVADKAALMEAAAELGVPVPRQVVVRGSGGDRAEILALGAEVGWPLVVKPHRSAVVGIDGVERFGVRLVADASQLDEVLANCAQGAFPVLVQERVQGPGLGGFFLAVDGEVVASFAHKRLREKPPTGGVSVLRESVPLREDLRRYSEALLGHYGWSGVAMVEFKEDARTGTPYLMEINGRFWGSLQLAIDSGVDFPRLLLERLDGSVAGGSQGGGAAGRSSSETPYRVGVRSRWLWGDVDHLIWLLRAPRGYREANPALPGRATALLRFLVPWSPGVRYEVLRLSDPLPFVRESALWFREVLRRG
jgi:predicted ATP-grasp superfamily ATP-dependent carboligase